MAMQGLGVGLLTGRPKQQAPHRADDFPGAANLHFGP